MRRYVIHEPFNIYHFEASEWQHPPHSHTYFEIIFIFKGNGTHYINGNNFKYKVGDVFLLGPEDSHFFEISAKTEFCYIRFHESFATYIKTDKDKHWEKVVKPLLNTSYQSKGAMVQTKIDRQKLQYLLSVLRHEYDNRHHPHYEVMRDSLMLCMMTILANSVLKQGMQRLQNESNSVDQIVMYIRQNITKPENLTIAHLAEKFNYAPTYLSIFFKNQTGEPLKQYITKFKLKTLETRLLYSRATLAEIADEFGFTDESHLVKQFRKYNGITPAKFRNQALN